MQDHQTHSCDAAPFTLPHLLSCVLLPLLPLWGALLLLRLVYGEVFDFSRIADQTAFSTDAHRDFLLLRDLLVYASLVFLHLAVCLGVVWYLVLQLRSLPRALRPQLLQLGFAYVVLLLLTAFIARHDGTAQQLTYTNVCEMLLAADVAGHLTPAACIGGAPSRLLLMAGLPAMAGIVAAIVAACVAATVRAPIEAAGEEAWRAEFSRRRQMLHRAFYAASAVLVTSTVTIKLFLELPLSLATDDATRTVVRSSADGLATFWGTTFTLVLVFIFAPVARELNRALARHGRDSADEAGLQEWLDGQALRPVPRRLAEVIAFLAPLLAGPVADLLKGLAG